MNEGVRRGLLIGLAAVLSIALLLVAAVALFGHGVSLAHDRAEARAAAFCEPIAVGADIASVASGASVRRVPMVVPGRTTEYRYRFFGGVFWEAQCRVTVDAAGRIVARRAGKAEAFVPDRVDAASAASSR